MLEFKLDFNPDALTARIQEVVQKAQRKLDAQIVKDSNYYCPLDTSMLQKSAITNTKLGSGKVVWNTPYAKFQYYSAPNKSHDKNPNATQKWFEVAKSKNLKKWEKIVNEEYRKYDN